MTNSASMRGFKAAARSTASVMMSHTIDGNNAADHT